MGSRSGEMSRNQTCWKAPGRDAIKINTDAAWKEKNGTSSIALIARNHQGRMLTGAAMNWPSPSSLIVEASALREALILASNLGWDRIVIESDCLPLIDACERKRTIGEIQMIVEDINKLKSNFVCCNLNWIPRRINKAAHSTAQLHALNQFPSNWCMAPPPSLAAILRLDGRQFALEPD
ncbi:uncharacterized protein LOC130736520 [Lotus japonicus]|uniref:uncharacterized protein LOC130736520 n=1 Tax=Lotus japonicus TaxID=34305 RepID=UPI00258F7BA7|nr:uncharacterized protein LOC130736520 [Lotus japonicus]